MKIQWRENQIRLKEEPSKAEKRIINHLNRRKAKYYREVEFRGLVSDKGYSLYFDFYIPSKNLLIEYDGPHHLEDKRTMENDKLKNIFCKNNKIKLKRLDRTEWAFIEKILNALIGKDYECTDEKKLVQPKQQKAKIYKAKTKKIKHIVTFKKIIAAYRAM